MFALVLLAAASPPPIQLSDIRAQLYYMGTGRLSDDVLNRPKPFNFWNTIIGEGDAEEAADDVLITVQLVGERFGTPEESEQNINDPVLITATDVNGKVVATRKFTNMLLSTRGVTTLPLWLRDVTCQSITVKATFRNQTKTASLEMSCGE